MDSCEFQSFCFFYNLMTNKPYTLKYLKDEFCDDNYFKCSRFMISKVHGANRVPKHLLPEDVQEACKMLDDLG